MTLHILFCPAETLAADGSLPTSSLSFSLDNNVQYWRAGYVHTKVERYAEQLDQGSPVTHENGKNGSDSNFDDDAPQPTKAKGNTGRWCRIRKWLTIRHVPVHYIG